MLGTKSNQRPFLVWNDNAGSAYRIAMLICNVVHCESIPFRTNSINITKADRGFAFGHSPVLRNGPLVVIEIAASTSLPDQRLMDLATVYHSPA